jgi:hypothetical protein
MWMFALGFVVGAIVMFVGIAALALRNDNPFRAG